MGGLSVQGNAVEPSRFKHNLVPQWFDLSRNHSPTLFHPSFSKTCKRMGRSVQISSFDSKPSVRVRVVTSLTTFFACSGGKENADETPHADERLWKIRFTFEVQSRFCRKVR